GRAFGARFPAQVEALERPGAGIGDALARHQITFPRRGRAALHVHSSSGGARSTPWRPKGLTDLLFRCKVSGMGGLRPVSNPPNPWLSSEVEYLDEIPDAKLEVYEDHTREILASNDSPDVGLDRK